MEPHYIAIALLSAALHAGWNAAIKARPNAAHAMTAQMLVAGLLMAPLLVVTGLPAAAALPWLLVATTVNTVVVIALLKGYALAGFGLVYPIGRAISVLLVAPGALLLFGERIGIAAMIGIAMISAALALLAAGGSSAQRLSGRAWFWIMLAGAGTAAFALADAQGVRAAGSVIAYGCCTSILNAAVMLWRQRNGGITVTDLRREAWPMLPVGVASVVSYLLILWLYTKVPVAPAAALRDTSALFAIVLAVVWLKEPLQRRQIAALVLAAAAVPLLRLG